MQRVGVPLLLDSSRFLILVERTESRRAIVTQAWSIASGYLVPLMVDSSYG